MEPSHAAEDAPEEANPAQTSSPSLLKFDAQSTLSPFSPQGLRKSISVDSFVPERPAAQPHLTTRPSRVHTSAALHLPSHLAYAPDSSARLRVDPTQSNHHLDRDRGLDTRAGQTQSPTISESDTERSDYMTSPVEGYTRSPAKGSDASRSVQAGELPLPSRTPAVSNMSSRSSSSAGSAVHEAIAHTQQQPTPSSSRPSVSAAGRTRSGSLGVYAPSSSAPRRMVINTQVPRTGQEQPITLVVVGATGCGKSIVIRKGLKGYGLSDPSASLPGLSPSVRYSRRSGRLNATELTPPCVLNVFEVSLILDALDSNRPLSTVELLPETPKIDGVIICYDATVKASFDPIEGLLSGYRALQIPTVVLACKSDAHEERQIDPQDVVGLIQQFDVGLVEVTNNTDTGREKMRRSFDWLLKAIIRDRRTGRSDTDGYRNPASPDLVKQQVPWDRSGTATPTLSSTATSSMTNIAQQISIYRPQQPLPPIPSPRTPTGPNSPARVRSTGDLLNEARSPAFRRGSDGHLSQTMREHEQATTADALDGDAPAPEPEAVHASSEFPEDAKPKGKEMRPAQWATIDELLDKLLFLAVSGDDPTYITHFLLTYRRFTTPRTVLLAMQKRMRQLDSPTGDPMFACFAQMRICHLLDEWRQSYPDDFAVRGTAGALSALVKSILSKTYLLHYGTDFLPFLEMLSELSDQDSDWAVKVDDVADESDDSYSFVDDQEKPVSKSVHSSEEPTATPAKSKAGKRERKGSLPAARALPPTSVSTVSSFSTESVEMNQKQQVSELLRLAREVQGLEPEVVAQEITRMELMLFLKIKPRHWLQYTFVSGRNKDHSKNPITTFNEVSNRIAAWVVSLILAHDKIPKRVRQIEKFVEIGVALRKLNNYSALRAILAGINSSAFPNDPVMEQFKSKSPELAKVFASWEVLLQSLQGHRAYRMALRNTKGACIPALEVHMSDLIRSHEGNADFHAENLEKIHWGKFNMMGRFISSTIQCQYQCETTSDYKFAERAHIGDLVLVNCLMDDEMQMSRVLALSESTETNEIRPQGLRSVGRENNKGDLANLRRFLFW